MRNSSYAMLNDVYIESEIRKLKIEMIKKISLNLQTHLGKSAFEGQEHQQMIRPPSPSKRAPLGSPYRHCIPHLSPTNLTNLLKQPQSLKGFIKLSYQALN